MSGIRHMMGFSRGSSIDPDYQAALTLAESEDIVTPTAEENTQFSNLIKSWKASGLWDRAKTINIYGFGSKEFGEINLKDPDTFRHSEVGTVNYADGRGVRSPSSGNYYNTNYKGNQYAGIESDLTTVVFVEESNLTVIGETIVGAYILSSSSATRYLINPFSNTTNGSRFAYNTPGLNFRSSNHRGLLITSPNTGESIIWKDGAKTVNAATPVTPDINNDVLFLTVNISTSNGGLTPSASTYKKYAMCLIRFDKFNDADELNFRNPWVTFLRNTRPVTNTYYVRPAGGSYGLEDGSSFENAWDGFADIDWTVFRLFDTLVVVGTHNEQLTVGAPYINIVGLYEGNTAVIDGQNTRAQCIYNYNRSYVTISNFVLQNATSDCLGLYDGSWEVVVNDVEAIGSGNQAFQNETRVKATYNRCIGRNCVDDGFSLHTGAQAVLNDCEFYDNSQGIHIISDAVLVANNCRVENNSTNNLQSDATSSMTINGGQSIDGSINGNSTNPIILNQVTRTNSAIVGNVNDN
jgi:hypothetical protein